MRENTKSKVFFVDVLFHKIPLIDLVVAFLRFLPKQSVGNKTAKARNFGKLQAFVIVLYSSQWENESYNRTGKIF